MTQFNAPTYDIERFTGRCALTDEPLAPGQPYVATLVDVDQPSDGSPQYTAASLGFRRIDISWTAWQQGKRPAKIFCFWKSTVAEPNEKRKLFVDDDVLMNLFRRLTDEQQENRLAFRFVLGLILMRKKFLRYDGIKRRTVKDDQANELVQEWWQVTAKQDLSKGPLGRWNDDDRLEILDVHLDEQQIQQVTGQLSEILQAEL